MSWKGDRKVGYHKTITAANKAFKPTAHEKNEGHSVYFNKMNNIGLPYVILWADSNMRHENCIV